MSFSIPSIPGQYDFENELYLKNSESDNYLYTDGSTVSERAFNEREAYRYRWFFDGQKLNSYFSDVISIDLGVVAPAPVPAPASEPVPEPEVVPEVVPEAASEPEPVAEPEAEEDVPVTRSAALIEEALNAKASESGAPTPDAPVEAEEEPEPEESS